MDGCLCGLVFWIANAAEYKRRYENKLRCHFHKLWQLVFFFPTAVGNVLALRPRLPADELRSRNSPADRRNSAQGRDDQSDGGNQLAVLRDPASLIVTIGVRSVKIRQPLFILLLLALLFAGCMTINVPHEPSQALPASGSAFGRSIQAQAAPHQGQSGFRLLSESALLEHGVHLFELRRQADDNGGSGGGPRLFHSGSSNSSDSSLHSKAMIFDQQKAFIGSFNFDSRSLLWNTEVGVLVDNPQLAGRVRELALEGMAPALSYHTALENHQMVWIT